MSLASGVRLGPYEVLRLIGAGGMGEVYRARDTRLERTVAIKILSPEFAVDPDRRARFEREARVVAALNHPHICALLDFGETPGSAPEGSLQFFVMEYLDGHTLAERLLRGPLPPAELLQCCIELADALDHAHRRGLVHRDMKPSNVMLTQSGAKLLDFGLSKAQPIAGGLEYSTISPGEVPLTSIGALLGTYPYMSPEQLTGREVDARSDVFALGAVIYEMATGRRAFDGSTAAAVIGAVLHTDPLPVSTLQPLAPQGLDRIVSRCLAKDPDNRWQTARDLLLELKWIAERPVAPVAATSARQKRNLAVIGSALIILLVLMGAAGIRYLRPASDNSATVRLTFSPPPGVTLADLATAGPVMISPDGRRLAFVATGSDGKRLLWVRELDSTDAKALPGTDNAAFPFWSPNSRLIGFFARGDLKKIDTAGGPPQTISSATQARGGSWNQNGVIVFAGDAGSQLYRTSDDGREAAVVMALRDEGVKLWPSFLPDGRHFVYFSRPARPGIYLASLDSPDTSLLAPAYVGVAHVPGYLLLLQSGSASGASQTSTLIARPFDADRLRITGEGFAIAEQVQYRPLWGRGGFSVSNSGTLVTMRDTLNTEIAWYDRRGQRLETVRGMTVSSSRRFPELSPDDAIVATTEADPLVQTTDIHLFDLARGIDSRLTSDPVQESKSRWSPDSTQIVFDSARDGLPPNLFRIYVKGGGRAERLLTSRLIQHVTDWSRDGRFLLFAMQDPKTEWDLWLLPMNSHSATGERTPVPLLQGKHNEYNGQFSRDGRWLAYQSDESGEWEIHVRETGAPADSPGKQISIGGGVWPLWRRDGQELFYITPDGSLMAVATKLGRELEVSAPRALFKTSVADRWHTSRNYTVARDGQRFLINERVEESSPITVSLNWPAALRR